MSNSKFKQVGKISDIPVLLALGMDNKAYISPNFTESYQNATWYPMSTNQFKELAIGNNIYGIDNNNEIYFTK